MCPPETAARNCGLPEFPESQIALKFWLTPFRFGIGQPVPKWCDGHAGMTPQMTVRENLFTIFPARGLRETPQMCGFGKRFALTMIHSSKTLGLVARALLLVGAVATLVPGPALADVRDGVNAWSHGDYAAAVRQWQGPAAKGDADAQFNMGQAAKLGRGMPKDMAKAEDWFHKAARQGHARAADNYGILLFQTGRQSEALPWLNASADRGEPRAMYVLGVAAFNGDFQPKDWVRAYGLMTRAAAVGLPQAIESLKTMNQVIPLEQRQMGASLAADLEARTSDQRARELASAELGVTAPAPDGAASTSPSAASPPVPRPAPAPLTTVDLPPARTGATASESDGRVLAGASYANPVEVPRAATTPAKAPPAPRALASTTPAPKPPAAKEPAPATTRAAPPAEKAARPAASGAWRIQLGAFAQKSNADGLWARVRGRAELAGHPRIDLAQGSVTRLLAGGFASQAEAAHACAALKGAGVDCIPVKP